MNTTRFRERVAEAETVAAISPLVVLTLAMSAQFGEKSDRKIIWA
jgi:hypothetical protein